jgi:lipopolysaccharide/colanic/teichoic acid biosynthesis glycosyltransferase
MDIYFSYGKRSMDVVLSGLSLLVLSFLMVLVCLLIHGADKGPPFFFQERVGKNFRTFRLVKFRSMTVKGQASEGRFDAGDTRRVTRIGRVLRRTKIDELPELFNVLRGDMSIVGPRPEVKKYVDLYPDAFLNILKVRPGLSDEASVKYWNEENILAGQSDPETYYREMILPDKLELAKRYCQAISFRTDLKIIMDTVKAIHG